MNNFNDIGKAGNKVINDDFFSNKKFKVKSKNESLFEVSLI